LLRKAYRVKAPYSLDLGTGKRGLVELAQPRIIADFKP
jgi:hypothetical protein